MKNVVHVENLLDIHQIFGIEPPLNHLISVIRHKDINIKKEFHNTRFTLGHYFISCKIDVSGKIKYGQSSYDFTKGSMLFIKPNQIINYEGHSSDPENLGWSLIFHPDLIRNTDFGAIIDDYAFFYYDTNEALHLSDSERISLGQFISKIEKENNENRDSYSNKLIVSNINLLLDYSTRYYERQFHTRTNLNKSVLAKFDGILKKYYSDNTHLIHGIPSVTSIASELYFSPKYLSDLLKKETGKSAKNLIDDYLMIKAKDELLNSNNSISEIAFSLGFNYSQHFAKMFKSKLGISPSKFREQK